MYGLALGPLLALAALGAPAGLTPGTHWEVREPSEAGLDPARLDVLRDLVGGRGCVVRGGALVYSWGDISARADVASAAKPLYAHLLLHAVEAGLIPSLDQPLSAHLPELEGKDRAITWRHCANQISCYGVSEHPGTAFDYNDWQMSLFIDTLFRIVYGAPHTELDERVLEPLLSGPLGCEDNPTLLAFGLDDRPGRLGISVRDFARFGLLNLRDGRWGETQLLPAEVVHRWVRTPLPSDFPRTAGVEAPMLPGQRSLGSQRVPDNQCDHLGSYSGLWWTNGIDREGLRHWPGVPDDAFGAFGHGGPRAVVVIPSLDLVVSWNDAQIETRGREGEALRALVSAVLDRDALGSVVPDPWDARRTVRLGGGEVLLCGPGDPEGFLYRGSERPDGTREGDQLALIGRLGASGANCLYPIAVRSHGGDGGPTENPFAGHDPARGLSEPILAQWDEWLGALDEAGGVALFFLYDDSVRIWETGDEVGPEERDFVRGLVGRLAHRKGLIWCIAEEAREALSAARIRALAAEVRAADPYGHPIAVHLNDGLDFTEFADDPNIDHFAVQYNRPDADELHRGLVEAVRLAAGRYAITLAEAADWGSGAEARRKVWACALAGAGAMVLGMDIESTPEADLADCGRLLSFLRHEPLGGLEPHDELADGGTRYVLADPGERWMLYSPAASAGLGLTELPAGVYWLHWFDCVSGESRSGSQVRDGGGSCVWPRPEGLGEELVLTIRRM